MNSLGRMDMGVLQFRKGGMIGRINKLLVRRHMLQHWVLKVAPCKSWVIFCLQKEKGKSYITLMLISEYWTSRILSALQLFICTVTQCCSMCNFSVSGVDEKPPKFNITLRWHKDFKMDYNKLISRAFRGAFCCLLLMGRGTCVILCQNY